MAKHLMTEPEIKKSFNETVEFYHNMPHIKRGGYKPKLENYRYYTFEKDEKLPFTQREAQIATGYSLRQKLSDIIFAIERKNISKDDIYKKVDDINYNDYAMQYLLPTQNKSVDDLEHDASLYAIEDFLKNNKNYIILSNLFY